MNQPPIDFETAESNLLAAAAYLAGKIKSSDGHAEATKEIVAYYIAKGDVDTAAQLADALEDAYVRDRLLVDVAEKCAAIGDDEYALQLADAVEDHGLQQSARESVAIQKAAAGEFDKARAVAADLEHPSNVFGSIAIYQTRGGQPDEALQTVEKIEDPLVKIYALEMIAGELRDKNELAKAAELLAQAAAEAGEIAFPEEKIAALQSIAGRYAEGAQFDKTIETLAAARSAAEMLDGAHRDVLLVRISVGFLRAKSIDLADRTLDLIKDKTQIAAALTAFAGEFDRQGERAEATDALEEAYAILKSQPDREVRDSAARFSVLEKIAVAFARFGKAERALEIAQENPNENNRFAALSEIAKIYVENGDDEAAGRTLNQIEDELARLFALVNASDAAQNAGQNDRALKFLGEAHALCKHSSQLPLRVTALSRVAAGFSKLGEAQTARRAAGESLQMASKIMDDSHRAVALAQISEVYEALNFELEPPEKETLLAILRRAAW